MELRSYCLKVTYNPFTMFIQKSKLILDRPQIKSNNRAVYIIYIYIYIYIYICTHIYKN